jgi:transcriptional regulator with XRE-family HTH domain
MLAHSCTTTQGRGEDTIRSGKGKKYIWRYEMNRLRQARLRAEKSQLLLMKETGIYFSKISRIERGWSNPTAEQKRKLAKALDVTADWLFPGGKGENE